MARTPFCSQVLFLVAFFSCHPERSRGTPIFLDASRPTPNHGSNAVCETRAASDHERAFIHPNRRTFRARLRACVLRARFLECRRPLTAQSAAASSRLRFSK